jgi:hypothetical protein
MQDDHLVILISVLQESCEDGKVVPRSVIFSRFENRAKSGFGIDKFKRALSLCINGGTISGYEIKQGRDGGVYKISQMEKVTVICSSGKFIGQIPSETLTRLIMGLKRQNTKKETDNGKSTN